MYLDMHEYPQLQCLPHYRHSMVCCQGYDRLFTAALSCAFLYMYINFFEYEYHIYKCMSENEMWVYYIFSTFGILWMKAKKYPKKHHKRPKSIIFMMNKMKKIVAPLPGTTCIFFLASTHLFFGHLFYYLLCCPAFSYIKFSLPVCCFVWWQRANNSSFLKLLISRLSRFSFTSIFLFILQNGYYLCFFLYIYIHYYFFLCMI